MHYVPSEFATLSANDLIQKLGRMAEFALEEKDIILKRIEYIEKNGGWGYANPLEHPIEKIINLAQTSASEVAVILKETRSEVKQHHIQRLERLGDIADQLSKEIGLTKHQGMKPLEDDDPLLHPILDLYAQARDLANSMSLFAGWSARLQDFMGSSLTSEDRPPSPPVQINAGRDINVSQGEMNHHINKPKGGSNFWIPLIVTIIGGLVVGYLLYQFGWLGNPTA